MRYGGRNDILTAMEFTSPLNASPDQRNANMAALQDRAASVMARVANDPKQSKRVRAANARDAETARKMAKAMRQS